MIYKRAYKSGVVRSPNVSSDIGEFTLNVRRYSGLNVDRKEILESVLIL